MPSIPLSAAIQRLKARKLQRHGGAAQANREMFEAGESDLPGNILFRPASYFDANPAYLAQISRRVYA